VFLDNESRYRDSRTFRCFPGNSSRPSSFDLFIARVSNQKEKNEIESVRTEEKYVNTID